MNTNQKGVTGLIKVIGDLQTKCWFCFPAFDDHSPIDLVSVNKTGQVRRLQIKYRTAQEKKNGPKYSIDTDTVINGKRVPIDRSMIDGWAVYLADHQKVVYIDINTLTNQSSLTFGPDDLFVPLEGWVSG